MPPRDPSELASNWQQQVDEVAALDSIYGTEGFRLLSVSGLQGGRWEGSPEELASLGPPPGWQWALECTLSVAVQTAGPLCLQLQEPPIDLQHGTSAEADGPATGNPHGLLADGSGTPAGRRDEGSTSSNGSSGSSNVASSSSNSHSTGGVTVCHLPPLELRLRLHSAYPSEPPQVLCLSALWLSPQQAAALEEQLQALWEEQGPGLPICFSWAEWLHTQALQHLGIQEALVLSGEHTLCSGTAAGLCRPGSPCSSTCSSTDGSGSSSTAANMSQSGDEGRQQAVAAVVESSEQVLFKLLRYNSAREHHEFETSIHTCAVCFEDKLGDRFVRLPCGHHYCSACLGEQCQIHVKEGSLGQLKCPEAGCGEALPPQVLRQLLDPAEFERWERLALQLALDRASDIQYCPRCNSPAVEDADCCVQCWRCLFVFCSLCRDGWHPGSQCLTAEAKLAIMEEKAKWGTPEQVEAARRAAFERLSVQAIEATCRRCPACQSAIHKTSGCNKMVCSNCHTRFCYKCGNRIEGYDHFGQNTCELFDEAEGQRWDQEEWEGLAEQAVQEMAPNDVLGQRLVADMILRERHNANGGMRADPRRLVAGARRCVCPRCRQTNYKVGNDNNILCWCCDRRFCYLCRQPLLHRGGKHFGVKGCKQHSND